ncbi:hypothetical protein B5F27_13970 [Faecalibacterium sp. An192]|nr:hypothetical protein B5F27_13970 [Faecalibacterium sp. An192]
MERVKYTVAEAAFGAENLGNGNPEEGGVVFLCFAAPPLTLYFFSFSFAALGPEGEGGGFDSPSLPPLDSLPSLTTRGDPWTQIKWSLWAKA